MHNYYEKKFKSQQLKLKRTFYLFIVIVIMTPNKGGDHINYQWLWPPILYFYFLMPIKMINIENIFFIPNSTEYYNN